VEQRRPLHAHREAVLSLMPRDAERDRALNLRHLVERTRADAEHRERLRSGHRCRCDRACAGHAHAGRVRRKGYYDVGQQALLQLLRGFKTHHSSCRSLART